jgi:hypothetical protein
VVLGPLRSVADARLMFSATAIAGRDQWDRHSIDVAPVDVPVPEQSELRVVVSEDPWFAPVDDDVRR